MDNNLLQNSVNATFSQSQKFHKAVKAAAKKKGILNTVIRASRTRKQQKRNTARRLYYSVIHNSIAPSKELCSKLDLGEVGVPLP